VSPSLGETWGTFPLEAAASGCAIVASDRIPSAAELAATYDAARIVRAGDAHELATAVIALLESPGELAELARRARIASSSYTPARAAASFLAGARAACGEERTS
jgi:glycosyltransferase involved in cell wall biosynthesis